MTKAKKMSLVICIILIIIGAVMYFIKGFNYDLSYGGGKRILVPVKEEINVKDFSAIVKEVYPKNRIEFTTAFKDEFSVKVNETNDEQLDCFVNKINEKYGYDYKREDLTVTELSKIDVFDIVKQAIIPVVITSLVVMAYLVLRYKKIGIMKVLVNFIVPVVVGIFTVFGIYLTFRISVNNILLPVLLTVYIASVMCATKNCNTLNEK